jgi:hypothetical protein
MASEARSRKRVTPKEAPGPMPAREEIERLVNHLKAASRPWVGARFFSLLGVTMLARLNLIEALDLDTDDVPTVGTGRIAIDRRDGRDGVNPSRYGVPPGPPVSEPLRRIVELWRPRTLSPYLFPNQCRTNRWDYSSRFPLTPGVQLHRACDDAGTPRFTFRALRLFGEVEARYLSDPRTSPFWIEPDDANCLRTRDLSIGELRHMVVSYYDKATNYHQERHFRYAFEVINRIPEIENASDLLAPSFLERFASEVGVPFPFVRPIHTHVKFLHGIYGHCIRVGCFDVDPFAEMPGFRARGVWRDRDWSAQRARLTESRPAKTPPAVELATPAPDSFDPIELARLSGQQRELVLLINSQEPEGASGPWIGGEFRLTSYRYHLKKIANLSEYWRLRIDFPGNPGEPYHVRIN